MSPTITTAPQGQEISTENKGIQEVTGIDEKTDTEAMDIDQDEPFDMSSISEEFLQQTYLVVKGHGVLKWRRVFLSACRTPTTMYNNIMKTCDLSPSRTGLQMVAQLEENVTDIDIVRGSPASHKAIMVTALGHFLETLPGVPGKLCDIRIEMQ